MKRGKGGKRDEHADPKNRESGKISGSGGIYSDRCRTWRRSRLGFWFLFGKGRSEEELIRVDMPTYRRRMSVRVS